MANCNLDPVNLCCWTHGVDIGPEDCGDGHCHVGAYEAENEPLDDEPYYEDDPYEESRDAE